MGWLLGDGGDRPLAGAALHGGAPLRSVPTRYTAIAYAVEANQPLGASLGVKLLGLAERLGVEVYGLLTRVITIASEITTDSVVCLVDRVLEVTLTSYGGQLFLQVEYLLVPLHQLLH